MNDLSRRTFLIGGCTTLAAGQLAGCVSSNAPMGGAPLAAAAYPPPQDFGQVSDLAYGPVTSERFPIPAIKPDTVDRAFLRSTVAYAGREPPGTIVVDPAAHYLYEVLPGNRATRYGIGVGKAGFAWSGTAEIRDKQEWPDWYPPKEMIARRPDLKPELTTLQGGLGMPGGPRNPLGARAMYLWQGNKDTLYRIHGTVEPETIGRSVSSGCIRMLNQDVMDLYDRTPVGTKVVVLT